MGMYWIRGEASSTLAQVSLLMLMLLAPQTVSKATASSTQRTCRFCHPTISANCTDEKGIVHCHVNFSSCPRKNCSVDDNLCLYHFNGYSTEETSSLTNLTWYFNSNCFKGPLNRKCSPQDDRLELFCIDGVSSENGYDPEVVEYQTEFNFTLPPTKQPMVNQTDATTPATTALPVIDCTTCTVTSIVISIILFIVLLLILIFCLYKLRRKIQIPTAIRSQQTSFINPVNQHSWQLLESIGHGRYGFVYRAKYRGEIVAVKIYTSQGRSAFETEQNLYSMESTFHCNILEYIGCEMRGSGITTERALLTRYYQLGSLDNYLRSRVLSWQQACVMIHTVAEGLAHLHSEYYHNSAGIMAEKYPVAHRDVKSANVLVRSDSGDCVISDLGFALILDGKQTTNTVQAGTYRYMAPEALDARVNLHDLQSFKQIDVYSLALVMWEVMSRTCVLTEEEVPGYQLPYKEEAGPNPSLERLKDIVVTRKLRPSLPAIWGNHETLNSLQETLYECWDDDAEARLSAANVTLRMKQLIATNINDIARKDSTQTVPTSIIAPEAVAMNRPTEHSQSSPPPYYSPTDPIPFQQQSDISRQESTSAITTLQSDTVETDEQAEHSQSGPPPYYGPTPEDYLLFQQTMFTFNRGPIRGQQRHQVSMPHICSDTEHSRTSRGHMAARCTHSLRSSYHYEQEMRQLNNFNKSESLSLRNMAAAQESVGEMEEEIRELSQSPLGTTLEERIDDMMSEAATHGDDNVASPDGQQLDISDFTLNLNSDSGILNAHSDLSHSDTIGLVPAESDTDALTSSVDSGVPSIDQDKMVEGATNFRCLPHTENNENSASTVTSV